VDGTADDALLAWRPTHANQPRNLSVPVRPAAPADRPRRLAATLLLLPLVVAACGGLTIPGQGGQPAAPSVDAPAATVAPVTPSPILSAHDAAIAAFVERVAAGDFTYRVSYKGRAALSVSTASVTGHTDVDGADFATDFTYKGTSFDNKGDKWRIQIRAVNGKAWAKGDGAWTAWKGWRDEDTNIPFHAVATARDVTYVDTEELDGKTVHRVAIKDALLIDPLTIPGYLTDEKIRSLKLELLIDDHGKPLAGTWRLDGQGRVGLSSQLQGILYQLDLTFSKVGADISIKKP
jgi:hypothetical protein